MATRISKSKFKTNALEIFRQIEASGQSVIITDHGRATLELRPYPADQSKLLETLRHSVISYGDLISPVGEDDWEAAQ